MISELPPPTVRDRIMDHLIRRFKSVSAGVNGRYVTWDVVSDTPLSRTEKALGTSVGIFDSRERKTAEVGYERCLLDVQTEFRVQTAHGDNVSSVARGVLGELQAVMRSDIYCTENSSQLTLNIVEVGNELDVDGPNDKSVAGIVFWEIQYRHKTGDPRKLQGEK